MNTQGKIINANHVPITPVLKAVCSQLHDGIQESHQILAQVVSVTVVAQHRMVFDASMFWDCGPRWATLLSTPFVGTSLFGGQFQSSV